MPVGTQKIANTSATHGGNQQAKMKTFGNVFQWDAFDITPHFNESFLKAGGLTGHHVIAWVKPMCEITFSNH